MMPMEHIDEWYKDQSTFIKILFKLKVLHMSLELQQLLGKYFYEYKARLIHPITWFLIMGTFITNGFNKESLENIKQNTCWW